MRFAVCDAERFLARHFPPGRAAEVHCYHPQPYYDPAQTHRVPGAKLTEEAKAALARLDTKQSQRR